MDYLCMDYLCAKFGDFSFNCFGFTVRTDRQTHRQNHRGTSMLYPRDYSPREFTTLVFAVVFVVNETFQEIDST